MKTIRNQKLVQALKNNFQTEYIEITFMNLKEFEFAGESADGQNLQGSGIYTMDKTGVSFLLKDI